MPCRAGGASVAILSDNRSAHLDGAPNSYVDYTRYCPRQWFSRSEQGRDVLMGRLGFRRRYAGRMFIPAIEAVRSSGADVALVYEGHLLPLTSLPYWRDLSPDGLKILYVHNPLSRTYGRRELQRLFSHADAVVFCAEHLRQDALRRLGPSTIPLQTIHNGFDRSFLADAPRVFPGPPRPMRILFAGQVAPHKGAHVLVEALVAARNLTDTPLELTIVGSGAYDADEDLTEYEQQLRASVRHHGLEVEFLPFVDKGRLLALYRAASIVCIPSVWPEGFPLVALEAMATGTPVVCFDAPGLSEACGDAAAFARFGDAGDLGRTIAALAGDPARLEELSRRGLARAGEFSWPRTYETLATLIAELRLVGPGRAASR